MTGRKRTISEFEVDIEALATRLREVPIEGTISYDQLSEVIGRDVRSVRYLLLRARDRVEEDGIIMAAVHRVGLRRLPVDAFHSVGHQARSLIKRKARKASRTMARGLDKANDVPAEVMRKISAEQSVLGLIEFAVRETSLKRRMEKAQLSSPTPLGVAARQLVEALGMEIGNGDAVSK